jgi:Uma2 family endonuclease
MSAISEKESRPLAEQRITLRSVSWETYERLLADLANQSSTRLTYDQGTLEIMSPLFEHEKLNRRIALLIEIIAEEMSLEIEDSGSTTFSREDLARGFEPDSSFYIQNEAKVRGKENIDLSTDPPPDLIVEIDITSGSLNKLPIYAQLGVAEVWRHDGQKLTIYKLVDDQFTETDNSLSFPMVDSTSISDLIEQSKSLKRSAFKDACRKWIQSKLA